LTRVRGLAAFTFTFAVALAATAPAALGAQISDTTPAISAGAVYVTTGQALTLRVKPADSGSTGYHWRVASPTSRKVVRLKSSKPNAAGSRQVLRFVAKRPGYAHLKLVYVSPGRSRKVARRADVNVIVNAPEPKVDCDFPRGATTHAFNGAAKVFTVRRSVIAYLGGNASKRFGYNAFYGCELATGQVHRLSTPDTADDVYNVTLNGSLVGFVRQPGCPFTVEGGTNCSGVARALIEVVDLHTGKLIRQAPVGNCGDTHGPDGHPGRIECNNDVTGLVLSPTGGVAWIEGKPFYVIRSDEPAPAGGEPASDKEFVGLDEPGTLDPTSLHYDGSEFSYVRDGQRHTAPLR
jgi:hypothetical protein